MSINYIIGSDSNVVDSNHLVAYDNYIYPVLTLSTRLNWVLPTELITSDILNVANTCSQTSSTAVVGDPCGDLRKIVLSINPMAGNSPTIFSHKSPSTIKSPSHSSPSSQNTNNQMCTNSNGDAIPCSHNNILNNYIITPSTTLTTLPTTQGKTVDVLSSIPFLPKTLITVPEGFISYEKNSNESIFNPLDLIIGYMLIFILLLAISLPVLLIL